jgi:hypothetical protein
VKRAALLAAALVLPATLPAQAPTVSRSLAALAGRDTVVAVWFFGRESVPLPDVVAAVEAVGGRVRRRSGWLHAVSANVPTTTLAAARRRPEFRHLQLVARFRRGPERAVQRDGARLGLPFGAPAQDSLYGPSAMPFRRLHLFPLVDRGLDGSGVTIAMLDTGFDTSATALASATVVAQRDYVCRDTVDPSVCPDSIVGNEPGDPAAAWDHGTRTWSLLAAELPGTLVGVAPKASYLLAKTEDVVGEATTEEDNWVAALEWADSLGADVVSSSLGYGRFADGTGYSPDQLNGDVAITTIAADLAAERGIAVVVSAGNCGRTSPPDQYCVAQGFRSVTTPADGDSVLAAGAEDSLGTVATFSSRGPTADGRMKPDLMAPGVAVLVANPSSFALAAVRQDGTSFAAPLLAGAVALYRQANATHGPMDAIEALKRTGDNAAAPDSTRGWGRPDAAAAVLFPRGVVATPTDSVLPSVTPVFEWSVPDQPAVAGALTYRLVIARDTLLGDRLLDTTLVESVVQWHRLLFPGDSIVYQLTASTTDTVTTVTSVIGPLAAPAWATLLSPDDPGGVTIREVRPTFRWSSPEVSVPPGPFRYDLELFRADDGIRELIVRDLTALEYTPDRDLERNTPYRWRVAARLGGDSAVSFSAGTFVIIDDTAPATTLLFQNFPNPFPSSSSPRPTTCLWFDLARGGRVTLDILDLRGHVVRTLVPADGFPATLPPGRYGRPADGAGGQCDPTLEWNGLARDGSVAPRGVYLARLGTPDGVFFKRIVFRGGS